MEPSAPSSSEPSSGNFVPRDYQRNPETEDLVEDGIALRTGMIVLIGDPDERMNIADSRVRDIYWHDRVLRAHSGISDEDLADQECFDRSYYCEEMEIVREALRMNRWCKIVFVEVHDHDLIPDSLTVVGEYSDGSRFSIFMPIDVPWLVKKESTHAKAEA